MGQKLRGRVILFKFLMSAKDLWSTCHLGIHQMSLVTWWFRGTPKKDFTHSHGEAVLSRGWIVVCPAAQCVDFLQEFYFIQMYGFVSAYLIHYFVLIPNWWRRNVIQYAQACILKEAGAHQQWWLVYVMCCHLSSIVWPEHLFLLMWQSLVVLSAR